MMMDLRNGVEKERREEKREWMDGMEWIKCACVVFVPEFEMRQPPLLLLFFFFVWFCCL